MKRNEEIEEKDEKESQEKGPSSFSKYKIPIIVIIVFALGIFVANSINVSISGATIASSSLDCQNRISALEVEKSNLQTQLNIKSDIENQLNEAEDTLSLYNDILRGLQNEADERIVATSDFFITWDKYIHSEPGKELVWSAEIENVGSHEKKFSLRLEFKSLLDESIMKNQPAAGSLILKPQSSGTLDVKMTPNDTGYVIFGIYVNDEFVGNLVLFSY